MPQSMISISVTTDNSRLNDLPMTTASFHSTTLTPCTPGWIGTYFMDNNRILGLET